MPDVPDTPLPGAPKEPLLSVGTLIALCTALLGLLAAFGLKVDDDTQAAIIAFLAVAAPLFVAVIGRTKVWSPASVRAAIIQAKTQRATSRKMPYTGAGDEPIAP